MPIFESEEARIARLSLCIVNHTCFPLDPCLSDLDCRFGRWPCNTGTLMFGEDQNLTLGQCESTLSTGSIFFFAANVLLFALVCCCICTCRVIPIICCFRFLPCCRKRDGRKGGHGGKKGKGGDSHSKGKRVGDAKADKKVDGAREQSIVGVSQSADRSKILQECPKAPLPNLRAVYQASRLAGMLVSHDTQDGDGVVLETINSRALASERLQASKRFRTCALLGALLDLDPQMLEKVEDIIASGFAEAHSQVTEGLKASTPPAKGKKCLDRAVLLFQEIMNVVIADCFPWYEGAPLWPLDGAEHKALDQYILQCQDIIDTGVPERSCVEICRRAPRKSMPELPKMPMFAQTPLSVTQASLPQVSEDKPANDDNKVEVTLAPQAPEAQIQEASARKVRFGSSTEIGIEANGESIANRKKLGLVGMASEICMQSTRTFDTSLISSRKLTIGTSAMHMDPEVGTSATRLVSKSVDDRSQAAITAQKESMLARLGRTVSRMQTERAMANILASSPPAALPDLDKLFQHADLCADLHDGAQIMTLNGRGSESERVEAVRAYRIAALFCKLLDLDPSALSKSIADKVGAPLAEAQALMTEGMKGTTAVSRATEAFTRATSLLLGVVEVFTGEDGPFHGFPGAAQWTTDSLEFLALDEYVHDCMLLFEDEPRRSCLQRCWHRSPLLWRKLWQTFGIPDSMRNHPTFYFFYLLTWILLVFRFFIVTCDIGKDLFDGGDVNITLNVIGTVPAHICLQEKGRTYLGVGPQYKAILGKGDSTVDVGVPLMFGVMHSLLFIFGTLPVPMARGFWRDVSYWLPWTRRILPIDDHIFLHKFLGYLALFCLFVGAALWVGIMGGQNCFSGDKHAACTAFDPENIGSEWFNLFVNVVMLRVVVITLWFWGITWMRYQNTPPKYWFFGLLCFKRLPTSFRQHFFEYAYILHVTIALATFILAEAARFQVFYPVMATWGLYIVDSLRETLFMTFRCDIEVANSVIHLDPSDHNRPTTMTVKFENPWRPKWRGGCIRQRPSQGAGMWVFVKIPAISNIEWHPFSLASAEGDDFVQLQIGIRPGVSMGWRKPDNWVLDNSTALSKVTGEGVWVQKKAKTWTYQLYELLLNTQGDTKIPCKIRGPYGSSFRLCFNRNVKGALIMGAGTGLSAVESMLRAMLHRKESGRYTPNHVWICWQARRVGDLLWLWDSLNALLIKALKDGVIQKPLGWTPASKTLGFLRITFFISRSEAAQLDTLRHLPKRADDNQNVHEWLTSRNRIIQSSISNEGTHISKYIRHIRAELNRLEDNRRAKLGISFCGPAAVSKLIADAATEVGGRVEFSSDATA